MISYIVVEMNHFSRTYETMFSKLSSNQTDQEIREK